MKRNWIYIGIMSIVLLIGCQGAPKEAHIEWTPPPVQVQDSVIMYRIADHKTQALGEDIPAWVIRYDSGGIQQVEYLSEYQDVYIFIGKNTGTNFRALQQWNAGFRVFHDFARLAAARIQARFILEAATFPDQEYGAFFETVIKAASDAAYTGAVQEADFWIKKQYVEDDGITVDHEEYVFFILVSIDKTMLEMQIDAILNNTAVTRPLTKEQLAAIALIKETFFEGF